MKNVSNASGVPAAQSARSDKSGLTYNAKLTYPPPPLTEFFLQKSEGSWEKARTPVYMAVACSLTTFGLLDIY